MNFRIAISPIILLASLCFVKPVSGAIVLGLLDDFQGGTTEGWSHNQANAFQPINVANQGPTGNGDSSLQISSSGTTGAGSRFLAFNSAMDWTGNYTAAGVTGIQFEVNNTGASNLNLRLALNGAGGWFITSPFAISTGGGWQAPQVFDVTSGALIGLTGSTNVNLTLANVTQAQIMSAAGVPGLGGGNRPVGDRITANALFDNFTAVPEPTSGGTLLAFLGLLATNRRRHRRLDR